MKKISIFSMTLLLMLSALLFVSACFDKKGDDSTATLYSITFRQDGQADVVKHVEEGKNLNDIPEPKSVPGYTVVWENKDFTNISSNLIVLAVQTANIYTIKFDMSVQGIAGIDDLHVIYGQEFTLPQFTTEYVGTHDCYDFLGWYKAGTNKKIESGIYTWTDNLDLEAKWSYSYGTDQII